jgi:hypothetical protein
MATSDVFDAFRAVSETLSTDVYRNATWSSVWLNVIPRESYQRGAGLALKTYVAANSEPSSDDESWTAVALANGTGQGACAQTYTDTTVGMTELSYAPEAFGLRGPTLCKDDLSFDKNVDAWLGAYLQELTKRARRSWEKRDESIYLQLCDKLIVGSTTGYATAVGTQKLYSNQVGLAGVSTIMTATAPTNNINQNLLDAVAMDLINIGASDPDSSGFIGLGDSGPLFSLYIHPDASKRIVVETGAGGANIRQDLNYGSPAEILKRLGATRMIRNWRHVPNLNPPRFILGATATTSITFSGATTTTWNRPTFGPFVSGATVQLVTITLGAANAALLASYIPLSALAGGTSALGANSVIFSVSSSTVFVVASTTAATVGTAGTALTFGTAGQYWRIPTYVGTAINPGKGYKYTLNPDYTSTTTGKYEGAIALSSRVFASEIVPPTNSSAGVNWDPTNTLGEWQFVTGGERISGLTTGSDPLHKLGAHYAEFKHAPRPMFPSHGKILIYDRTSST